MSTFPLALFLWLLKSKMNSISQRKKNICGFIYPHSQLNIRKLKELLELVRTTPLRIEIIEAHQEQATFFLASSAGNRPLFQYQGETPRPLRHVL